MVTTLLVTMVTTLLVTMVTTVSTTHLIFLTEETLTRTIQVMIIIFKHYDKIDKEIMNQQLKETLWTLISQPTMVNVSHRMFSTSVFQNIRQWFSSECYYFLMY